MPAPSKQATAAKTALAYVTVGTLTVVWTIIYYLYLSRREASDVAFLVVYGLFATGCMLTVIGLAVGRLGRSAMKAEVAPTPDGVVPGGAAAVAPTPAAAAGAAPGAAAPLPQAYPAPSVR